MRHLVPSQRFGWTDKGSEEKSAYCMFRMFPLARGRSHFGLHNSTHDVGLTAACKAYLGRHSTGQPSDLREWASSRPCWARLSWPQSLMHLAAQAWKPFKNERGSTVASKMAGTGTATEFRLVEKSREDQAKAQNLQVRHRVVILHLGGS